MADDDESLDDILSTPVKAPEAETPETPEAEQPSGPVRDEHGRFAPKGDEEAEQIEQPEAEQGAEPEHNAPIGAVMAERRKAQAAQAERDNLAQQLAEMRGQMSVLMQQRQQPEKPKEEPKPRPQLWDDPDQWGETLIGERLSPIQEQLAEMTFRTSRAEAIAEFGRDTVTAAQEAVKAAVQAGQLNGEAVKAQLSKSRDPVGDVVRWHQSSPAVQETSLRTKLEAEILAKYGIDPAQQQGQPVNPAIPAKPLVKMPPSLNRIPAGHSAPERDESLDEVLSAPRRRA